MGETQEMLQEMVPEKIEEIEGERSVEGTTATRAAETTDARP